MKKLFTLLTFTSLLFLFAAVSAQEDVIVRTTPVPVETISLVNPNMSLVNGDNIISGTGNYSVTLWDRSKYVNQPKSVVLPNAREVFADGMEVPKPSLDRPITDPWDDLKQGYACEAILNRPYYFQKLKFGEPFELDITFRNVGTQTWDFNIDFMMYTGDQLQQDTSKIVFDIWKDIDPNNENKRSHIVQPGESIRVKLPMIAPKEKYHDDDKYYAAYTLVRNWNVYGMDALHDGHWDRKDGNALFCPVYFYIYVPETVL